MIAIQAIKPGVRVQHRRYGKGTVLPLSERLTPRGEAFVQFDSWMTRMELGHAPSQVLGNLDSKDIVSIADLSAIQE